MIIHNSLLRSPEDDIYYVVRQMQLPINMRIIVKFGEL